VWRTRAGDYANTQALLDQHGDLAILVGDERQLARPCGPAPRDHLRPRQFRPDLVRHLAVDGRDDPRVDAIVNALCEMPVIPAVKVMARTPLTHRPADDAATAAADRRGAGHAPSPPPSTASSARRPREGKR